MEKSTCSLILFFFCLLYSCSNTPEYIEVALLTTKVHTAQTADYSETRNAYFGDLHVHTSWSFDAFIYNVRTSCRRKQLFWKNWQCRL